MTDEATPTVESLGMVVDGNALGVTNMMGAKTGSAEVKVDGSTYTITGEAAGRRYGEPDGGHDHQAVHHQGGLQLIGRIPEAAGVPHTPAASYDSEMTILADLERARRLAFAADEVSGQGSAAVARSRHRSRRP